MSFGIPPKWRSTGSAKRIRFSTSAPRSGAALIDSLFPGDTLHVGIDHHLHQRLEIGVGLPAKAALRLGGIPLQQIDLSRPKELGIDYDMSFVVEPDMGKRDPAHLPHGGCAS